MARIGILGGTFDPIHNGHLALGKQAYEEFGLERIWFMPSGTPPHKKDHRITEGKMRRDMVMLAIADIPCFLYSDFEMEREGNTYTALLWVTAWILWAGWEYKKDRGPWRSRLPTFPISTAL